LLNAIYRGDKTAIKYAYFWNEFVRQGNSCKELKIFDFNICDLNTLQAPIHIAAAVPSLCMIVDLSHEPLCNTFALDCKFKTPRELVPKQFLTSKKMIFRYERVRLVEYFQDLKKDQAKHIQFKGQSEIINENYSDIISEGQFPHWIKPVDNNCARFIKDFRGNRNKSVFERVRSNIKPGGSLASKELLDNHQASTNYLGNICAVEFEGANKESWAPIFDSLLLKEVKKCEQNHKSLQNLVYDSNLGLHSFNGILQHLLKTITQISLFLRIYKKVMNREANYPEKSEHHTCLLSAFDFLLLFLKVLLDRQPQFQHSYITKILHKSAILLLMSLSLLPALRSPSSKRAKNQLIFYTNKIQFKMFHSGHKRAYLFGIFLPVLGNCFVI